MPQSEELRPLLELLNCRRKRELQKLAREQVVSRDGLAELVLAAQIGALAPLEYLCRFVDAVPEHLPPSDEELRALARSSPDDVRPGAAKAMRKVAQIFRDRRSLAVHFLYARGQPYWHLFYFDQRDLASDENHWRKGSHLHYSSDLVVQQSPRDIWEQVLQDPPELPKSLHIPLVDEDPEAPDAA